MATVLIAGDSEELKQQLGSSALFDPGIEQVFAPEAKAALRLALAAPPTMVVVDGAFQDPAFTLIRCLRDNPRTRACSVVALSRVFSTRHEEALRRAGANLVMRVPGDISRWNSRLAQLLAVARRCQTHLPVHFEFWAAGVAESATDGVALNLSVSGLLLETGEPLDLGMRLDIGWQLPGQAGELRALGSVVRQASSEGRPRRGIEFLQLRDDARSRIEAYVVPQSAESRRR